MAKYKLLLQRNCEVKEVSVPNKPNVKKEGSTLGTLQLLDENNNVLYSGYTCENIGPATDIPKKDKPIVARTYKLEWTASSKNASLAREHSEYKLADSTNRAILLSCDEVLPTFRGRHILIHVGNYPQDTLGCILVGDTVNTAAGYVSSSINAVYKLYKAIEKVGIGNIELEVKDIENKQ